MKTTLILVIDHKRPIADLADKAAARIYTLDGVEDVLSVQPESLIKLGPPILNYEMPKPGFWQKVWSR